MDCTKDNREDSGIWRDLATAEGYKNTRRRFNLMRSAWGEGLRQELLLNNILLDLIWSFLQKHSRTLLIKTLYHNICIYKSCILFSSLLAKYVLHLPNIKFFGELLLRVGSDCNQALLMHTHARVIHTQVLLRDA